MLKSLILFVKLSIIYNDSSYFSFYSSSSFTSYNAFENKDFFELFYKEALLLTI